MGAAELAGGTAGFEHNSLDIPDCPAPSAAILCEKIGIVCWYVRDVGVAGSNPVTPTIDLNRFFQAAVPYGSRSKKLTVPKTVPVSSAENRA